VTDNTFIGIKMQFGGQGTVTPKAQEEVKPDGEVVAPPTEQSDKPPAEKPE
jgi:hypothetical protein